jgi:hypothetical protein
VITAALVVAGSIAAGLLIGVAITKASEGKNAS